MCVKRCREQSLDTCINRTQDDIRHVLLSIETRHFQDYFCLKTMLLWCQIYYINLFCSVYFQWVDSEAEKQSSSGRIPELAEFVECQNQVYSLFPFQYYQIHLKTTPTDPMEQTEFQDSMPSTPSL